MEDQITMPMSAVRKLLGAGNADAALLYLYLCAHRPPQEAGKALGMTRDRLQRAGAALRQLGLLPEQPKPVERTPEKPTYSEDDILREVGRGAEFSLLVQDTQRRLGRVLSTEEMKILLSLIDYLALPLDVIALLITYCIQKNRVRGVHRAPSMRSIEKEAYYWADHGIDTLEDAAAYSQQQLQLQGQIGEIRNALQLEGRRLTMAEENYVRQWLNWGFGKPEIHLAYEKTCLNKGALVWPYMNRILQSWHEQNLHTLAQIEAGDNAPARKAAPPAPTPDSSSVKAAYARLLAEEEG
ncbi:MAG: DnaD domain protein [Ruminococcaceae bacterium]|nr:DnaD domain protein [Oscillospiraceae bacterium]